MSSRDGWTDRACAWKSLAFDRTFPAEVMYGCSRQDSDGEVRGGLQIVVGKGLVDGTLTVVDASVILVAKSVDISLSGSGVNSLEALEDQFPEGFVGDGLLAIAVDVDAAQFEEVLGAQEGV
ncbi:hypothetical protein CDD80_3066 [Ophiocordyceps camponoti-rufipedis]|uniref:Uncharacterized protein n=1 Tax=Ophiocordyceps camponoti-rufipedis TaxID=2004952 RepID=A0A2C5Z3B6_9HYPO|nr:hypothetical protein CDD80_3066 [Ophiocordyceps camponoti-rufipedis]